MNPDDTVLIALVNHPRDWELIRHEHWYRMPTRHAPRYFASAQYLAFYFARSFGESKWTIPHYATVRGHELVRRRDLLPAEPNHPRADELYYQLQLGPLQRREPPIVSKRGRRLLFLWTTWEKFARAQEINDLFHKGPAQDQLWEALKENNLDAEREMLVREGRSRYRVDFLIYCSQGTLAVMIGERRVLPAGHAFRRVVIAEEDLENHFQPALERIKSQARELGESFDITDVPL